jgi:ketosteroid isomerase-like protein
MSVPALAALPVIVQVGSGLGLELFPAERWLRRKSALSTYAPGAPSRAGSRAFERSRWLVAQSRSELGQLGESRAPDALACRRAILRGLMSNDNVELVRGFYRAASVGRFIDQLDEAVELDFSAYPVPGAAVLRGRQDAIDRCRSYWGTWDEYILEPGAIIAAGEDQVVVVRHERARGKGSGVRLERDWAVIFTIRAGGVVRVRGFQDQRGSSQPPGCAPSLRTALGAATEAALAVRAPASASGRAGSCCSPCRRSMYQSCLRLGSRQPCAPRTRAGA